MYLIVAIPSLSFADPVLSSQIVASFREMVDQKLGGQGASQSRG